MNEFGNELGQKLSVLIGGGYKFLKSQSVLVKKDEIGFKCITLDLLPASRPGWVKLAMSAQVRLNDLEDVYSPHHIYLGDACKKGHPTIVFNCDMLFTDKSLSMSFLAEDNKLDEIVLKYHRGIVKDVVPVLDEFYSVDRLVSSFEEVNPKYRASSNPSTRYLVLLSAYHSRCDWDSFEKVSNEWLAYCEKPHAKVHKPLAKSIIHGLQKYTEKY